MKKHKEKKDKSVTLKDIASKCNVSLATVSRVLSGSDYPVSSELREKITLTADEMNYRPNVYGQMLRKPNNNEVGIILPSLSNFFYGELLEAVEQVCLNENLNLLIGCSFQNPEIEIRQLDYFLSRQICGLMLSSVNPKQTHEHLKKEPSIPIVLFDQSSCNDPHSHQVCFDFYKGGVLATEHLIELGHKRLIYLYPKIDRPSRQQIFLGICDVISKHKNIGFDVVNLEGHRLSDLKIDKVNKTGQNFKDLFSENKLTRSIREEGEDLAEIFLAQYWFGIPEVERPDGLIVVNDFFALVVMHRLQQEGLQIPDDLSIIGFDDIWMSELSSPSLTTIRQSAFETGDATARLLADLLKRRRVSRSIRIIPTLIKRDSTAPVKLQYEKL